MSIISMGMIQGIIRKGVLPVVLLLAGCTPIPFGWEYVGDSPTNVAVVGDSLTFQAEHGSIAYISQDPNYYYHYLTDELNSDGFSARIAAKSGADTRNLSAWGQWAAQPDVIVMALGTNDLYYGLDLEQSKVRVQAYLAQFPDACVVYVGVKESTPRNIHPAEWNAWLAAQDGVFVDWNTIVQGHGDWFIWDYLHMNGKGQEQYRMAIGNGVKQCL